VEPRGPRAPRFRGGPVYAFRPVRVALCQLNPTVGDLEANAALAIGAIGKARAGGASLVVLPELVTLGYPPRDLLLREGIAAASRAAAERVAAACTGGVAAVVGFAEPWPDGPRPGRNALAFCRDGRIEAVYAKRLLPTYDVFDEDRYFTPGERPLVVEHAGVRIGLLVCEDLWRAEDASRARRYRVDPVAETVAAGAELLAVASASPFTLGKDARHRELLAAIARRGVALVAVNQAGGNDELVFDGRSRAFGRDGRLLGACGFGETAVRIVDLEGPGVAEPPALDADEETFLAIRLGLADYFRKTGHCGAVLGLSGGIDSALVAALAAAAIGPERVRGLLLPSRHSSDGSLVDARDSAARLGLGRIDEIPIEGVHAAFRAALGPALGEVAGLVDENLQSRIRGTLVMAAANAGGGLALSTGNKSELFAGYATLYGDMNGGLAPIGDLTKGRVRSLARFLNREHARLGFRVPPVPESSLAKPPSAELRPDQRDEDTLPPYEVLDVIVEGRIEHDLSLDGTVAFVAERLGTPADRELVARWCRTADRMEFKRMQGAIVLKLSPRSFGRGRTMPAAGRSGEA
jgi:NAD+ synthase (glutamine-hydrolysing)